VDREQLHFDNEQSLRFTVIRFLKSFAEEGVSDIMKQEASYENKKMQGYEASPLQKLLKDGTKVAALSLMT
jgi:hypothetical protein